ncbi:MAG: DUF2313 domain-containing protein [Candidatus Heteroscillospira sp.]|jgi:hypothetical protein
MGYGEDMRGLLRPLGIYRLDGGFSGAELDVIGSQLDGLGLLSDRAESESFLVTAENEGLLAWEELFPYRPLCLGAEERRKAVAALMRIDGRSFTPAALNDTVLGSGAAALVEETDTPLTVAVSFPGVRGRPEDFPELKKRIDAILPCHLNIDYHFRYPIWLEIEAHGLTWGELDAMTLSWEEFERTEL